MAHHDVRGNLEHLHHHLEQLHAHIAERAKHHSGELHRMRVAAEHGLPAPPPTAGADSAG